MKLKLVASMPEDGYALVRDGESNFLLRPPYDLPSRVPILANDVSEAILKHGFIAEDVDFASYCDLIEHCEAQIERSRAESGIPLPQKAPLFQALELAPPEIIRDFLRRTEMELIPKRKWDHAEDILLNILAARKETEFLRGAQSVWEILRIAKQTNEIWQPKDARFKTQESEACKIISLAIKNSRRIFEPAA